MAGKSFLNARQSGELVGCENYRMSSKISSPDETQKFRHLVGLEEFYHLLNKATKP